jgi:hypothetical protein
MCPAPTHAHPCPVLPCPPPLHTPPPHPHTHTQAALDKLADQQALTEAAIYSGAVADCHNMSFDNTKVSDLVGHALHHVGSIRGCQSVQVGCRFLISHSAVQYSA